MLVQRPLYVTTARPTPVDRAFTQLTREIFSPAKRNPAVDAGWRDGALVLTVDTPGVPAEALDVEITDRVLSVRVAEEGGERWSRTVQLGSSLDPGRAEARYVDGRLTVTIPELPAPAARRIAIDTTPVAAPPVGVVDAGSTEAIDAAATGDPSDGATEATAPSAA